MSSCSAILIFLLVFLLTIFIAGSEYNLEEERSYPTPVKDSPLLPDLLESLSKQKINSATSDYIYFEYDYIVVGAGAAGSVVAGRLSEVPCVSVLLLEAGPPPPILTDVSIFGASFVDTNLDWQDESTPQKHTGRALVNRKIPMSVAKALGGSTMHNAGAHIRGNKKNYDDWAKMGAEGWSYEEVLPYFKKLEDNQDWAYIRNGYHGVGGPITVESARYISEIKQPVFNAITAMGYRVVDSNGRRQTGFYDVQGNMRNGQRCSSSKAYLVPAENRTNLDILPNAFVTKVVIVNSQAVGVLFDYNGQTYEIHARREVILSGGAIKTPQLLMLSGIGPEEHLGQFGIPVHANLSVGMNFQDHPIMTIEAALRPHFEDFDERLGEEASIKEYIANRTGPLASVYGTSFFAFLLDGKINPEIDFPNYELYLSELTGKGREIYRNLKPEVYEQVYGPYKNGPMMQCLSAALHPKSRGRIQLRSRNPYDHPVIDPNYFADPSDVEDIVQGLKTCKRILERPEMKQVVAETFQTVYPGCEEFWSDEDAYFRCLTRTVVSASYHFCCTAKMGRIEDPTTVLDPQLRVKNIKGLRVVDASVMPIITSNTGVPTVMIGEKAADMIKETIRCDLNYAN